MHACGVTFSDGTLYVGLITIYTTNSNTSTTPPVVPPSNDETDVIPPSNDGTDVDQPSNDKDSEIIIDINNLTQVEIPNFIPNNSKVDYVIINGKKLPVIYKNLREDKQNIKNPSSNNNKNESLTRTSNTTSKLPNTGSAVTSSFIGTLITGIGAVLFRRKK